MANFNITVKRLRRLSGASKLKAFVDITIAELFLIKELRIVHGRKGLFVGMPREQGKDGQWYPTMFPLSEEVKNQLSQVVLKAYQEHAQSEIEQVLA